MIDLRLGHCLDVMRGMDAESVNCIVTSPPYWGLRSYGTEPQVWANGGDLCEEHQWATFVRPSENKRNNSNSLQLKSAYYPDQKQAFCTACGAWRGELGLEPTPELYVEHLVMIFREARRVLREDGTVWLNLGDSYAGGGRGSGYSEKQDSNRGTVGMPPGIVPNGLKSKDLVGIPWRVAFALQADGWWLRSDIIWSKPNPMPESVTDRPTRAHEYIFLLAKSQRYYYDAEAIKELGIGTEYDRTKRPAHRMEGTRYLVEGKGQTETGASFGVGSERRNRRSVWTVSTHPYSGAHFATFPEKLVEPCILAGTSARGICPKCGAPWERVIEKPDMSQRPTRKEAKQEGQRIHSGFDGYPQSAGQKWQEWRKTNPDKTVGWRQTCSCAAGDPIPAVVLDLFGGSGTTGKVAERLGRNAILIDLKAEYLEMQEKRTRDVRLQPHLLLNGI